MRDIEAVKKNLILAADDLFGQLGFEKTSISDISYKIGRSKTSLYYHFKDKYEVFSDVIKMEFDDVKGKLQAVRDKKYDSEKNRFTEYLTVRMTHMQKMKAYRNFIQNNIFAGDSKLKGIVADARKGFDSWEEEYFRWICDRGHKEDIFSDKVKSEMFSRALINILKGLEIQFYLTEDEESMEMTYEGLIDLLIFRNPILGNGKVAESPVL
ncbi:MAG: TetR/AcrR family transcriptional regulator [Bacteroidales bacterium]|jgi:AcrR family transcriptional regulator|nr:TetR/AcrR family transcriptional regulator [Bacteroidales bacterium]MCI2122414.1 TetR/AcrR family transcriptional regulator [Bacteroidales bacterium]MCI2144778.1 TetR/AcrR family transcriptional regulator [Bacteroidales bacterium]